MQTNVFRQNSPELKAYWQALDQGKLFIPYCRSCARSHWYPRGICPHCFSYELEPREASGKGVIFSYTHAPAAETAVAYVSLEEGPTLLARIVDVNPTSLAIGQRVQLASDQILADPSVIFFKPAA
ncbi:zinc ribbon domain-containing protein [Ottowia caeni]|uniref:Zn-ribbon domain-containing OB-fold protein n=1 Tax=Ottowia caeni TaxID=2870339 RepID=UPI001E57DC5F|nr:zinc ribbon domain-containing protein [Ottowia caeni]